MILLKAPWYFSIVVGGDLFVQDCWLGFFTISRSLKIHRSNVIIFKQKLDSTTFTWIDRILLNFCFRKSNIEYWLNRLQMEEINFIFAEAFAFGLINFQLIFECLFSMYQAPSEIYCRQQNYNYSHCTLFLLYNFNLQNILKLKINFPLLSE